MSEVGHNGQIKPPRLNRFAVGPSLAVLFCPAPNKKTFAVTIDRSDLERVLAAGFWRVSNFRSGRGFALYCYRSKKAGGCELLHRFIAGAPAGVQVDHAHHRTLDNRRGELREASQSNNSRNARCRRDNVSGYRGVTLDRGRYKSRIWIGEKRTTLGIFSTPIDAAKAYDEAAKQLHGEFACLNFPEAACR